MSTDVPLLNDYKKKFVRNRLLQTFLGGIRLSGCPWYAALIQLGLVSVPAVGIALVHTLVPLNSAEGNDSGAGPFFYRYNIKAFEG